MIWESSFRKLLALRGRRVDIDTIEEICSEIDNLPAEQAYRLLMLAVLGSIPGGQKLFDEMAERLEPGKNGRGA